MSRLTKKPPVDTIELHFTGPAANREKAVKALSKLGFTNISDVPSDVGKLLADTRLGKNITQQELATLTGIPQRYISEMENGKRPISKEAAKKFAKTLKVSFKMFM
jgi:ribosome-binding protein aMBF1 (putative translation factor)